MPAAAACRRRTSRAQNASTARRQTSVIPDAHNDRLITAAVASSAGNLARIEHGETSRTIPSDPDLAYRGPVKSSKNWGDREIEANLQQFKAEQGPLRRYASFDYCFNYFQSYREQDRAEELAENMQVSCLHLGFYLASWGMFRGRSVLLTRSVSQFEPVIKLIARTPRSIWQIDANEYTAEACEVLAKTASDIQQALAFPNGKWPSPTLATKIMLGVFGNVPAFDSRVRRGLRDSDMTRRFGPRALGNIGLFYHAHREVIDRHRDPTLDFGSQKPTGRT
jgi:hypothetical protein